MKTTPFADRSSRFQASAVLLLLGGICLLVSLSLGIGGVRNVLGLTLTSAFVFLAVAALTSERFRNLAFTAWVFAFVTCALFHPAWFTAWGAFELKRAIPPLVQIIMFGMGMTLGFADFGRVARMPKAVLVGMGLQYTVMPLAAFTFAKLFGLGPEVATGLILIRIQSGERAFTYWIEGAFGITGSRGERMSSGSIPALISSGDTLPYT